MRESFHFLAGETCVMETKTLYETQVGFYGRCCLNRPHIYPSVAIRGIYLDKDKKSRQSGLTTEVSGRQLTIDMSLTDLEFDITALRVHSNHDTNSSQLRLSFYTRKFCEQIWRQMLAAFSALKILELLWRTFNVYLLMLGWFDYSETEKVLLSETKPCEVRAQISNKRSNQPLFIDANYVVISFSHYYGLLSMYL